MRNTRTKEKAEEGLIILGLQKHGPAITSLILQNRTVTVADAIAMLQGRINAITAAQTAKVAHTDAVKQQDQQLASTDGFVASLVMVIRGMYAGSPSILADFGQFPKVRAPLTAAQKAAAAEKRAATRKARHTMGSKQKAAITGATVAQPTALPATPGVTPVASGGTGTPHS